MSLYFWLTVILSAVLFWLGQIANRAVNTEGGRIALWIGAFVSATPGLLFALYYTKLLGEPIWLYKFRTVPGTELTAAGLGFLAGVIHSARESWPRFKKLTSRISIPFFFAFTLFVPYLKPLAMPLRLPDSPNGWFEDVCKQSSSSTCGPASAATLARLAGKPVDEYVLARESFTSERGTENWYLARALKRHGLQVEFLRTAPDADELPYPAIAGVKLAQGAGHFIPILGKEGEDYVVGDPMVGREVKSLAELRAAYRFTGFFLSVK